MSSVEPVEGKVKLTAAQQVRALSQDARYFAASMFKMMAVGSGTLTFRLVESRPSDRSQAALDELLSAGLISVEPFNSLGGVVYRPLVDFPSAKAPSGPWPITVPIALSQEPKP